MVSRRRAELLKLLDGRGMLPIAEVAERLGISAETARRDIRALVDAGSAVRSHGAVGLAGQTGEAPFDRRMRENAAAKRAIARAVASGIGDGASVMLDTGTTTSFIARELLRHRRLTVVTNSSDIARILATVNGNRVYMAGGELRRDSGAALGASALEFIGRFSVEHAVISAGAVDAGGVMDFDLQEAEFARAVLACGARRIVATDATKFGRRGFIRVTDFAQVDVLVTDRAPPDDLAAAIKAAGGQVMTVG
ncbi:MAG: DeoR/GlpR family DNA-binding transcription regulator [Rhodobacteraceae bacterium]|nr:DeoR/GlpR family DNA-binding transcription regulator [Paracoccaceae bacterium]MCZ8082696.1 DeoR/GlpR family DNA-binding transcription regulator [Paracoccaceae bacterium]